MKEISATSYFQIIDEKEFSKLMAKLVPEWKNFLKAQSRHAPEEIDEASIRHATGQIIREHPEVVRFNIMMTREFHRRNYHAEYHKYHTAPGAFRAMFAEV